MDYNQLKMRVLRLFDPPSEYDSAQVREMLAGQGVHQHGEKAVEMALLRYWRQGLLTRARKGRKFYYRLTERGLARKDWLVKTLGTARTKTT